MPELPEVETVKRMTEPQIRGLSIVDVNILNAKVIARPEADTFAHLITGQRITGMGRQGKFLSFNLESGDTIVLHLRMTGHILVTPADYPEEKHTHLILKMENGTEVRYTDLRRFGRFWLIRKEEEDLFSGIHRLGKEPFASDFNADYLESSLSPKKRPIKECLLDQSLIAGIGNIYADESLFASGILPMRPANTLTRNDWEQLAIHIPQILKMSIKENSVSFEEYLISKGRSYRYTPFLKVYGKSGHPCPQCQTELNRTKIGGRSSVYCPKCQV